MKKVRKILLGLLTVCALVCGTAACGVIGDNSSNSSPSSSVVESSSGANESSAEESSSEEESFSAEENSSEEASSSVHKHEYTETITKNATCTEEGEKTFTCECGDSYTEPIGALGHDWVKTEEKSATCTETGWTEYEQCSRCECYKDGYKGEEIPALGHDWNSNSCSRCEAKKNSQGLKYALYTGMYRYYEVTGIGTCEDTDIVIPSTYQNLQVKSIGESAFDDCGSLTSVTIGNNVTSIGKYAFV